MDRLNFRPAPLALAASLLITSPALWAQSATPTAHPSSAASELGAVRSIQIAAQPLGDALNTWARQTGTQIAVEQSLVAGKTAPAVTGGMTAQQALNQLLAGSGLEGRLNGHAVVIRRTAAATSGPVDALPEVLVTANDSVGTTEGTRSYTANAATLTGIAQALKDIPQSISVVTRQRIEDQNLVNFDDVAMQTPGVSRIYLNSGQSGYSARGFNTPRTLVDGMQTSVNFNQILGLAPDAATLDRVEVLRGAPGLQFGAGTPGFVANMLRKRPLAQQQIELVGRVGSWGYKRGELDVTGPLNDAGTLRGRAVVAYEDRDYFYDRATSKAPLFYGILEADIASDTTFMAGVRYQAFDQSGLYMFSGLPVSSDGSDLHLPRSYAVGPSWSAYDSKSKEFFAELKHRFNADWSATWSANKQRAHVREHYMARGSRLVDPITYQQVGTTSLRADDSRYEFDRSSMDMNAQGGFDLWGRRHELRIGATGVKETRDDTYVNSSYADASFNAQNPFFSDVPTPHLGERKPSGGVEMRSYGIYGNAVLQLTDPLKLVVGARLNWYESSNYNASGTVFNVNKQSRELTPFIGLSYALTPQWSAYASYADIFQPQATFATASGRALDPAIGSNYELGFKAEGLDGRFNASAAIFRIEQTGLAARDTDYPDGGCPGQPSAGLCYVNGGKVRSEGVELEVSGEILRGLQGWAAYTYTDAFYLRDRDAYGAPTAREGAQYAVIPRHTLRVSATYDLPGVAHGWSVGGGFSAQSDVQGNDYNGIARYQSGRTVWDALVRYRFNQDTSLALNVKNLFDKRYYSDEFGYRFGEPRNFMVTLRTKF